MDCEDCELCQKVIECLNLDEDDYTYSDGDYACGILREFLEGYDSNESNSIASIINNFNCKNCSDAYLEGTLLRIEHLSKSIEISKPEKEVSEQEKSPIGNLPTIKQWW